MAPLQIDHDHARGDAVQTATGAHGAGAQTERHTHALPEQEAIVERLFDAFSRRDLLGALELMHPDIVFQPVTASLLADGRPYRGHDGIRRYVADLEAAGLDLTIQPVQIRAAGEAVVALGRVSGRSPVGSFEEVPTTWVLKFKDSLVVEAQIFSDERPVRKALGQEA